MNDQPRPRAATGTARRRPASGRPGNDRPALRSATGATSAVKPRFLTAAHTDPFWRQQAQLLADVWRTEPTAPPTGLIWDRGRVIGDATWNDILTGFSDPIRCDPENPDAALLQRLGERLIALHRVCGEYRLGHATTARITETFLASVLFESEIPA